jgi:hypothetical protein
MKNAVFILILILLIIFNPDQNRHQIAILQAQSNLGFEKNASFLDHCDHYDYLLFSVDTYLGCIVSIGFINNVQVHYRNLTQSLKYYKEQISESGPDG